MSKPKSDIKVLKGQDAEDAILAYARRMNRPYGAVDIAANLKGVVPKTATQKILVALAEKGELVQKAYGKTSFFVANQDKLEAIPADVIAQLETEHKAVDEENTLLIAATKTATTELAKLRATPSETELNAQITAISAAIAAKSTLLVPLRTGAPLISVEDLARVDADWIKWRTEWVRRKKIFTTCWGMVTDSMTSQEATDLSEELGIELDTQEHVSIERGSLCQKSMNALKRKR